MFKFIKIDEANQILKNGSYIITSKLDNNKVFDVDGASQKTGTNVQLWSKEYAKQQRFEITYLENGYYSIKASHSGQSLDVDKAGYLSGTNVAQSKWNTSSAQQWYLKDAGNGYFYIMSKCNGLYLDIYHAETRNGANVEICNFNGGSAQKFKFEEAVFTGIDVSKYQKNIDWSKVKKNVDYAMIRIGFRGYGEAGNIAEDTYYEQNITSALNNGIRCGVYFFSQAINKDEGIQEAKWVLDKVKNRNITYPIAIDTESAGGRADNISVEARTEAVKAFLDTVENAGYNVVLYSGKDWIYNKLDMSELSEYDVWLAHYVKGAPEKKSDYKGKYVMWQYTSKGTMDGILGNVDKNLCYKKY